MISNYLIEDSNQSKVTQEDETKLLSPFQRTLLSKNLEKDLRPEYIRRIKIMLMADSGYSQTEICQALNCSQETARYWILAAKTGQAHKWKELSLGRPKRINEEYLARLKELVSQNPRDCGYAFSRWTAQWLSKHLAKEFNIEISDRHINRLLKKMGLSTRPKQSQKEKNNIEPNTPTGIVIKNLNDTGEPESVDFRLFPGNYHLPATDTENSYYIRVSINHNH
ncbi:MAG: helix-turn-helix domain-containing protein [Xenococcaceae cyanobacterium MO_167.B27]|nr:helix-turn-helix domain-containing protein [Xenococcaceae cyanobacterium MO_167.B27]